MITEPCEVSADDVGHSTAEHHQARPRETNQAVGQLISAHFRTDGAPRRKRMWRIWFAKISIVQIIC